MQRPAAVAGFCLAIAAAVALPFAVRAASPATRPPAFSGARTYAVMGSDSFAIGDGAVTSAVTFRGTQRLSWKPDGRMTRYDARVAYERREQSGAAPASARYVSDLAPTGEQRDLLANDPEYLSVLNQPFSVRLDLPTLADLRRLRTDVPFDFPSPMTGSTMHGRLRHLGEAPIDGRAAVGVGFVAAGTMSGRLPDRPSLTIRGAIALRGTAYYDAKTALLLSARTTVTIVGNVSNPNGVDASGTGGDGDAVHITYTREIRSGALPPAAPDAPAAPDESGATPGPVPVPTASG